MTRNNYDYEYLLELYGISYLEDMGWGGDVPVSMDDFDSEFSEKTPTEIVSLTSHSSFDVDDSWFAYDGYGYPYSFDDLVEYLKDTIDEDEFIDWCVDESILDEDEGEDEDEE